MKKHFELALARARERLRRLETHEEHVRGNGLRDERIDRARKQVADLEARVEAREEP